MPVGPNDYIDQMLVKKYAEEKVDNHEQAESAISENEMYAMMGEYGGFQREMLAMSVRMKQTKKMTNTLAARTTYGKY